jgi:hypothetical protein
MRQTQDNKTVEKETIKKTIAKTKIRKLIKNSKRKAAKETIKSQKHKEIHKKKKRHYLVFSISLSYSFLQLLDLQREEDKNSNNKQRRNVAHETRAMHPASFNA